MNYAEEFLQILSADTKLCALLWNPQDGWKQLGECSFLHLSEADFVQNGMQCLLDVVSDCDRELCKAFLSNLDTPPNPESPVNHQTVALRLLSSDNRTFYCNIDYDCLWENGEPRYTLCRIRELTAEEIYRINLAQSLTNDKNPLFFANGVKEILNRHPDRKYALVQFDIAKFKMINEQFGEDFGTEVLNFILHSLMLLCNEEQLYTRLSADAFMIFTAYETRQDILDLIDKITKKVSKYKEVSYRLDFDVSYVDDPKVKLRTYGDNAAFARKSIKNNALTHVAFFNDTLRQDERIRKLVEDNMESALEKEEFVMFLQPKYSISQNKMIGAEALVRWNSPERGLIQPMEFIPLFEQNNFIIKVDYYVWEQACKTVRAWIDSGIQPIPISVNMSRKHLQNNNFIKVLNGFIEKYRLDKKYLEIEITETVKSSDVINSVGILKENGYTLLLDDFGSGYSTLSTLKDTQFDILKLDREILQNLIGSERGEKIVEHIVHMTQSIGLDLIAEGVETKEQTEFLSKCGCDKVQGYYYAKPLSLDDFNNRLYGSRK